MDRAGKRSSRATHIRYPPRMAKRAAIVALLLVGVSYALGAGAFFASLDADIYAISALPFFGSILTFLLNTTAIVLGIVALRRAKTSAQPGGRGRAIAAIVLAVLGYFGTAFLLLWALIAAVPGH